MRFPALYITVADDDDDNKDDDNVYDPYSYRLTNRKTDIN